MLGHKPPGTCRVFVFGESAALGIPAPEYSFSKMLDVLLRERFPGRQFEIVNTSMVAINSHVIAPIAHECAGLDGDLWVIYMGNNEVIGPFGAHGVFGGAAPARAVVKATLALKATRVGQLLDWVFQRLTRSRAAPRQWHGMQMWKEAIRREDPKVAAVHRHFRENLLEIIETGRKAGVPVLLCTMPCNERSCSPFASLHSAGLKPEPKAAWDRAWEAGRASQAAGDLAGALSNYQAAASIDANFAELQFQMANCFLGLGRDAEAQKHFQTAKDHDGLQFRPDTQLNDVIHEVASAGTGVKMVDTEKLFADKSPAGTPGKELFYEHVHLTPQGNYLLARAVAEAAEGVLGARLKPNSDSTPGRWLSEAECQDSIALTQWGNGQALNLVQHMIEEPPFTEQSIHSNQVERLTAELKKLRPFMGAVGARQAAYKARQDLNQRPDDPDLCFILASALTADGDLPGAEAAWRKLTQLTPRSYSAWLNLAHVLEQRGQQTEAEQAYRECLERNTDSYEAHGDLGLLLYKAGRPAEAIPHLRALLEQQPGAVSGHRLLAHALLALGERSKAQKEFEIVLKLDPTDEEAKAQAAALRP